MQTMKKEKVCCIVGHQPTNLRFGYSENDERCIRLKESLEEEIKKLIQDGVRHFMCPMNIGAEIYAAEIIERHEEIKLCVTCSYEQLNGVLKQISSTEARILTQNYDMTCTINLSVPKSQADIIKKIGNVTEI